MELLVCVVECPTIPCAGSYFILRYAMIAPKTQPRAEPAKAHAADCPDEAVSKIVVVDIIVVVVKTG